MNLRHRKPSDSLYMLLDTMCDAFGGIILLAVLVVLLTNEERIQNATNRNDSTALMQRRVALAQTNLQQSLKLAKSLHATANDNRWKSQVTLLAERQQLEDDIKHIRELAAENEKQIDANASSDPTERLKQLDAQAADAEVKRLTLQNSIDAAIEQKKHTTDQLTTVEKQLAEVKKISERELRLPKEHDTDREAAYAIVMYGRVYFCRNADMSRNDKDIEWTARVGSELAAPKKGRGLDPVANAAQIKAYCTAQMKNNVFIDFVVLPDSFPAFIQAKQLAVETGIPFGWIPWRIKEDGELSFSAVGYMPKPQ